MSAHVCKPMQLARRGVPLGLFRMVSFGVSGKETPFALCPHSHETVDEARRCPAALENQRSLNAEARRGSSDLSSLFGRLFGSKA